MNILWINHEYPPIGGGGGTMCKALAREHSIMGHNVTIVTAGLNNGESVAGDVGADIIRPQTKGMRYVKNFEAADGVDIYRLKCRRMKKDSSTFFEMLSFLWAAYRFVPKLHKEKCFDVNLIFFGIPNGPIGLHMKKRYNVPYIIYAVGGDVPGTQERFRVIYKFLLPFLKSIWKNAVCVVANSKKLMERAQAIYNNAKFTVITNGVDAAAFARDDKPEKENDGIFKLITTARIVERKGIQHVIEALPRLVKETGGNIRYTVVGDGPYRPEIEALAEKLGVADYLDITGMIPFEDVKSKLHAADVFVLSSHWEGMPNAVTEAMASGLPIIMSNCEGSEELVDDNGFIINIGDNITAELKDKVLMLFNNRALAKQMGQKSAERVHKHFRWDKSAAEFLELLERNRQQ